MRSGGKPIRLKVEKTYTIEETIELLNKKINSNKLIIVMYNSKVLDKSKTLEYYGIQRHDYLEYSDNCKGGGIDMADISNEKGLVQKNYGSNAPKWNRIIVGLNVSGKCKNENCEAYEREVDCKIGIRKFDLVRDADEIRCPMCLIEMDPTTCVFCECE